MKHFHIFILILLSLNVHAWEAREDWSSDLSQELIINCESDESLCQNVCKEQYQCRIETEFCRSCVGTNLFLSYFYQEVGRWFVNSREPLPQSFLEKALRSQDYVLLTAKSPYNIFSSVNDTKTEQAFNSLCPSNWDSFPVVLGVKNKRQELVGVSAVICHGENGAEIYKLSSSPEVERAYKKGSLRSLHY